MLIALSDEFMGDQSVARLLFVCRASCAAGIFITHSPVVFKDAKLKFRLLRMQPTNGGWNSIIVCQDIVITFGYFFPAEVTSTTGPGSNNWYTFDSGSDRFFITWIIPCRIFRGRAKIYLRSSSLCVFDLAVLNFYLFLGLYRLFGFRQNHLQDAIFVRSVYVFLFDLA
jgi:hypothetical protein